MDADPSLDITDDLSAGCADPDVARLARALKRRMRGVERDGQRRHEATVREFDRVGRKLRKSMSSEAMTLKAAAGECNAAVRSMNDELVAIRSELQGVRNYASEQQEQLRKYEDGFSWRVVKDVGARIMRVIDGIDHTLSTSTETSGERDEALAVIRDELVFALDAQGIVAIVPELNAPFRGKEAQAKCVRTERAASPEQDGRIAEVLRCGYLLETADRQGKLVRPAEVVVFKMEDLSNE